MLLQSAPSQEKRLQLTDSFTFLCHKDLPCFNACCRNKHIPLTPYDLLRLKNGLKMTSDDFLMQYTVYSLDPDSGFPIVSLSMGGEPDKECPFVSSEGCRVYNDRPTACRLYPLGRASGRSGKQAGWESFFFMLETPNCLGNMEQKEWKIGEWQDDQGALHYIQMNDNMLDIIFHPKRDREEPLDERQLQKIMVTCFNLDVFREFVFNTRFLEQYEVDEQTCSRIKDDDTVLLNLGFAYLRKTLFG
jgi:Fe-S-cluster containining protein